MSTLSEIVSPESRDAICGACGADFKQVKLTPAYQKLPLVSQTIPDGFVPLDCPPCERRNLSGGNRSPIAYRPASDDRDYARVERAAMVDA